MHRRLQQLVGRGGGGGEEGWCNSNSTSGKWQEGISQRGHLERKGRQGEAEIRTEVEALSRMRHPHVVLLIGHAFAIMHEFMTAGSLQTRLLEHRIGNVRVRDKYEMYARLWGVNRGTVGFANSSASGNGTDSRTHSVRRHGV